MTKSFASSAPFPQAARRAVADTQLRANLRAATSTIRAKRDRAMSELPDLEALREAAAAIKDEALGHLDRLLVELERNFTAAGGHVHFATTAEQANDVIVDIVRRAGAGEVVKVKSMTSAETGLNDALCLAGIEVTETDLAELIVQLGDDLPSHIVVPAIHRNRSEVREIFLQEMGRRGVPAPHDLGDDPAELAAAARVHLRQKFLRAGVGISGANFAVAESGTLAVVESEGNGRMCLTLPEVLISVVGIDKVLPRFCDLEVFLQLLARSATGERMNPYTSTWSGVTRGDGPRQVHLVLLDNGRSAMLADPVGRQALRCIRCAACLNVCPVYERVGGHAYGSVYPGPIGSVLTPQLTNVASDPVAATLPFASTLCGACAQVCPVRIDIPRLLVHLRARTVAEAHQNSASLEAVAMATAGVVMSSPARLARAERLAGRILAPLFPGGRIGYVPGLGRWTSARDAPVPAAVSFRAWWQSEHGNGAQTIESRQRPALGWGHVLAALLPALSQRHRAKGRTHSGRRAAVAAAGKPVPEHRSAVVAAVKASLTSTPFAEAGVPRNYRRADGPGARASVEMFVSRLRDYKAGAVVVGPQATAAAVAAALSRTGNHRVLFPAGVPPAWLPADGGTEVRQDDGQLGPAQLEQFGATVTGCAVAVADTGTIVLDGGPAQGRRVLSLLPDHLVVVVLAAQLVPSVPDAIARLDPRAPQTWISGPSATSDIELSRVEGVHGPRHLDVIVVTTPDDHP